MYVCIHNQSLPLGGLDVLEIISLGEVHSKLKRKSAGSSLKIISSGSSPEKKLTKECPGNSSGEIFCCFDTFKFIHGSTIFATKLGLCKYNLNVHKSNTWCLHVEVHMFTQNSKGWVCIIQVVAAYLCRARFFFRWLTLRIPMANIWKPKANAL